MLPVKAPTERSRYQRPSETFLEILCEGGGCLANQCSCGQFWYADSDYINDYEPGEIEAYREDPNAKVAPGDSVHVVCFRGVIWVYDCECKTSQWLHDTEQWLLCNVTSISRYLHAIVNPLTAAQEAILAIEQGALT